MGKKGERNREFRARGRYMVSLFKILFILFIFRERGKVGERERETSISCLSHAPQPGAWPETQACALTENGISDFLVGGTVPKALNHTS